MRRCEVNETDLKIIELHYEDGMKESEIAASLGLPTAVVHEVLFAYEEGDGL